MSQYDQDVIPTLHGYNIPQTQWALVVDGYVQDIARTNDASNSPFPDVPVFSSGEANVGRWALKCTGGHAIPGYVVDAKGNIAPANGRSSAIPGLVPAYHGYITPAGTASPAAATAQDASEQASENGAEKE